MKRVLALAALGLSLWAATPATTVGELIAMVREGIRSGEPDGSLAKTLHKLRLSEQLDLRVIEELESEGAGPKSIEELSQLRDVSRELKPPATPPPFEQPPRPSMDELRRVLSAAHVIARDYSESLPDFICTQIVRRSDTTTGRWQLRDTLELRLTYFGQKEDYKLLSVNGRNTATSYASIGGAVSQGEFGSLLRFVFDPVSRADFRWGHWTRLRKRPAYVFSFHIRAENSTFRLDFRRARNSGPFTTIPGQRGFVWVDRETNRILRIFAEAVDIQRGFPVTGSSSMVDYEFTSVGQAEFLLPLKADVRMASRDLFNRNEVEFRAYRKFAAETSISFDAK